MNNSRGRRAVWKISALYFQLQSCLSLMESIEYSLLAAAHAAGQRNRYLADEANGRYRVTAGRCRYYVEIATLGVGPIIKR